MKILFAALALPFPPTNGHRLRNQALLRALRSEGHEISLVSFVDDHTADARQGELGEICKSVGLIPLPSGSSGVSGSYGQRLRSLASPMPYGAWRHRSKAMRSAIKELLQREQFDGILCDDIYNVQNLPAATRVPVILNKHDITHVILKRYLAYEKNPLKVGYGWLEYAKLRRWELRACRRSGFVLACSEHDASLLRALCPGVRFSVVPNVIDVDSYAPADEDDGRTVLYIGALDWLPNQDAAMFFASAILPKLREIVPATRFRVVGRNAPEELQHRLEQIPSVEFVGGVPDIRGELAKASICAVPLRIGSGTRLKILEAAAMGKAVVSTRVGAEGLNLADGSEILLADDPTEFAQAAAGLLTDYSRRREMGSAACRRVRQEYSLAALRKSLRQALSASTLRPPAVEAEASSAAAQRVLS